MKKVLISIIIILIALLIIINISKIGKKNNSNDVKSTAETPQITINSLTELFPSKSGETIKYKEEEQEYNVKVTNVTKEGDNTVVITEREEKQNEETITIQMKYEISSEGVIESGKYLINNKEVLTIYPTEIIKGTIQQGLEWKSVDGMITNKVTSISENQATIESSSSINTYEEGKTEPIVKTFVETRIYEKGKGVILHKTEIK